MDATEDISKYVLSPLGSFLVLCNQPSTFQLFQRVSHFPVTNIHVRPLNSIIKQSKTNRRKQQQKQQTKLSMSFSDLKLLLEQGTDLLLTRSHSAVHGCQLSAQG